jgi:hypothetical protein
MHADVAEIPSFSFVAIVDTPDRIRVVSQT